MPSALLGSLPQAVRVSGQQRGEVRMWGDIPTASLEGGEEEGGARLEKWS